MGSLFDAYEPGPHFDEVFAADGDVRPHYAGVVSRLDGFAPDEFHRREAIRDRIFRTQGITFTLADDEEGLERTFPLDLLPRIIPADEWATIERGRDYDDVAPLRGIYSGPPDHELSVDVRMRRLALGPRGAPGAPGPFPGGDA
jgi:hypothetical protein